jgi:hypothetical protein
VQRHRTAADGRRAQRPEIRILVREHDRRFADRELRVGNLAGWLDQAEGLARTERAHAEIDRPIGVAADERGADAREAAGNLVWPHEATRCMLYLRHVP